LAAIGALYRLRVGELGERGSWVCDTCESVAAEVAAALGIGVGLAGSYVRYARAMVERLPRVGGLLAAGDIDYRLFQTIVFGTDLIEDAAVLAVVDAKLAVSAPRWVAVTRRQVGARVAAVVARVDRDAVRRRRGHRVDREIVIGETEAGMAQIHGSLMGTDAGAVDARLDALAATVCPLDPRTHAQRRADGLGALAVGADRLGCRCARPDCAAGPAPVGPVVIHVVAEAAAVAGRGGPPGWRLGGEELVSAELVAELAVSARLRWLGVPAVDAPAEAGYVPSRGLADFVRCRDLTCRAPGCDRAAVCCDIDHTVPRSAGGATHASNLKCLCRKHHLLKTFWGWTDKQLPDGTVIWTLPGGRTYVTTPGSALLFPALCVPTGELPAPQAAPSPSQTCGERTAMMPTRRRTRAQDRAHAVTAERRQNQQTRAARQQRHQDAYSGHHPPDPDDPPPF
jgi:hypothetical protein